ncbi:hypothetical protein G647_08955 [Cladophialophora carrionii CBS 160.54]|uniref:FAD/NAD(P)-binding domain-containing protein n=1 Tax=Cladophialophora carrionii CBS 160.54 TaxID=1279043 RepID=V9CZ90_9EURO|nr:uncharacterized protein G647_08955 [Cladophialophora carrionii CBS 160.54]ETI19940.1 hypothetical protein G647_08955 [Cladophialophora carrionii CBS 160.54]
MAGSSEVNTHRTYAAKRIVDGLTNGATNGVANAVDISTDTTPDPSAHAGDAQHLEEVSTGLNDVPAYTSRKLRVVTIGAGYSGLTLAHKLQHQHSDLSDVIDHTIYEARSELGGTWLVNTYPGVVCDVPSHIYAFPFDPNPGWSRFFSTGPEIWAYMKKTAQKWNLERDIKYNHRVTGAYWQEDRGQWRVMVEHNNTVIEDYADILISAQGFLNTWNWPLIPGLQDFRGKKVHSASWDHDYDYSNKRIAVIGNGSSGIQILPQLAKLPGTKVTSFQRGPTWVVSTMSPASLLGKDDPAYNPEYTEEEKRAFLQDPQKHHQYRKKIIHSINDGFKMFVKNSELNKQIYDLARQEMAAKLENNPELCEKLIPKWELGCRRITPGEGYLEAFLRENVGVTQSPITKIDADSVHTTDGQVYKVDVVVCATGFDVSYRPQYPVVGRGKVSLADKWAKEPSSYLSLASPDMPNYFMFTGPNALIGHGSLMESLGWSAEYMIKWMRKIASEDINAVVPKQSVVDDFIVYSDQIHQILTWTGACRSWYKNNTIDGRVTATFAGSALLFKRLIQDLRPEDFDIEPRTKNRFRFLGNGFLQYELQKANDLAWYVEK